MKTVLFGLIFITQTALAMTPAVDTYTMSSIYENDVLLGNTEAEIIEGWLYMDKQKTRIDISVVASANCKEDQLCAKYFRNVLSASVAITDVKNTGCSTIYIAEEDKRPADGAYTRIEFESYANSKCMFIVKPTPQATVIRALSPWHGEQVTTEYLLNF